MGEVRGGEGGDLGGFYTWLFVGRKEVSGMRVEVEKYCMKGF